MWEVGSCYRPESTLIWCLKTEFHMFSEWRNCIKPNRWTCNRETVLKTNTSKFFELKEVSVRNLPKIEMIRFQVVELSSVESRWLKWWKTVTEQISMLSRSTSRAVVDSTPRLPNAVTSPPDYHGGKFHESFFSGKVLYWCFWLSLSENNNALACEYCSLLPSPAFFPRRWRFEMKLYPCFFSLLPQELSALRNGDGYLPCK